MMDIYGLFWGSTGAYLSTPYISPLARKGKNTLKKNPQLRDTSYYYSSMVILKLFLDSFCFYFLPVYTCNV